MHYYLATSRAQKEKQEPNGVLAHQAALAFPFVCGASRKPRKAFGFPRCPATGAKTQKAPPINKKSTSFTCYSPMHLLSCYLDMKSFC